MRQGYDIAVAYRICPILSPAAPAIFQRDKYLLSKIALESFKAALGNLSAKVWALLDNCPDPYEALFRRLWRSEDLVIERLQSAGNRGAFLRQIDVLSRQDASETVFFAEDDYLYLRGQFEVMFRFMHGFPNIDFVSPYDHPDYYMLPFHRHRQQFIVYAGKNWKTGMTTTCTFMTHRATLQNTQQVFRKYHKWIFFKRARMTDAAVWMSLTKHRVFRPLSIFAGRHPFLIWSFFIAWAMCWRQIVFGRKYRLWIPEPSIATHLVQGLMAPSIDWSAEIASRMKEDTTPRLSAIRAP